jgi:SAM-dependent methyltransferase
MKPYDIENWVKAVDRSHGTEKMRLFSEFQLDFSPSATTCIDPFSNEYRSKVLQDYEVIAGRPYSLSHESATEKIDPNLVYPFSSKDNRLIGEHMAAIALLVKNFPHRPPGRLLDLGVGWGHTSILAARCNYKVTAVDINKDFLTLIRNAVAGTDSLADRLETKQLDFSSITTLKGVFDLVLFFESFHHCLDHDKLIGDCVSLLADNGAIVFGGEPVYPSYACQWGLRLDSLSTYCIRKYGWLELGFSEEYIYSLLTRHGLIVRKTEYRCAPTASGYIARKHEHSLIPFEWIDVSSSDCDGWNDAETDGSRWTKGSGIFSLKGLPVAPEYLLILTNCSIEALDVVVNIGKMYQHHLSLASGETSEVRLGNCTNSTYRIDCKSWVPAALGMSADTRHLGVLVHSVRTVEFIK